MGLPRGSGDREFRCREPGAGRQQQVARTCVARLSMHMPPGRRHAALVQLGVAAGRVDLFDGHDGVAAARHHRAGHDLEAVGVGCEREHGGAGRLDAGDAEAPAAFRRRRRMRCHPWPRDRRGVRRARPGAPPAERGRRRLRAGRSPATPARWLRRSPLRPRRVSACHRPRQFCLSRALKIRSCSLKRSASAWTSSTAALFFLACIARSSVRRFSS